MIASPPYKNRPFMEPSTEVRRYSSLWSVVRVLRDRQLRLTLVEHLRQKYDPFEGSVPKAVIDSQVALFSSHNTMMLQQVATHYPGMEVPRGWRQDPWTAVTQRRLAKLRSAHVSCWTAGDESEGMWRLYCNDDGFRGRGVALHSTLGALEASVAQHDLIVSPITYRHYHEADSRVFTDELDPFMHKRKGFEHEREVRLLRYDEAHYQSLIPHWQTGELPPPPPELPTYMFLEWRPEDAVERIILSPYADDDFEADVRDAISRANPALAERVERSILDSRRYAPQH